MKISRSHMGMLVVGVALGLVFIFGGNSFFKKDSWNAVYYPEGPENLIDFERSGELGSLEECRGWVDARARELMDDEYDYECGLNCKPFGSDPDLMMCEETVE